MRNRDLRRRRLVKDNAVAFRATRLLEIAESNVAVRAGCVRRRHSAVLTLVPAHLVVSDVDDFVVRTPNPTKTWAEIVAKVCFTTKASLDANPAQAPKTVTANEEFLLIVQRDLTSIANPGPKQGTSLVPAAESPVSLDQSSRVLLTSIAESASAS